MIKASHSEIQAYLDCRAKHHFRYVLRLPTVDKEGNMDRGSAVHRGMEHLCGLSAFGGPDSWREAQDVATTELRRLRIESTSEDVAAVRAGVRAGHAYLMTIECEEVLGVELKIQPTIGEWTPRGAVDFIWRDVYGVVHVDDWKTCKELGEPTTGVPDGQTALYAHWAMETYGVDTVHAGRVYLRTVEPTFGLTKAGKFSQQNKISDDDYRRWAEQQVDESALLPDDKAEKFGPWWRADIDIVTTHLAAAILADQATVAAEIAERRLPVANRRPKMCVRCEYLAPCVDRMINGDFDPSFEEPHEQT